MHLTNKTVAVGGDLIVKGSLVLENVTLVIEGLQGITPKIEVMAGGRLEMRHTSVSTTFTERGYYFIFRPGSEGLIEDSLVENVQANNESFGAGEVHKHANLGGLTILADGFILRDSRVGNATGDTRGLLVAEASNVLIEGNTIYHNPRDGIRLADCSGVTIRGNYILDNGTYGVKMMNCTNSAIEDNVISGNSHMPGRPMGGGVFLEFGTTDITVSNNEISSNWLHGIVMPAASRVKVHDNTVRGNGGYGIYVFGSSSENEIFNNTISGNEGHGIVLNGAFRVKVRDNTIRGNGGYGTAVWGSSSENEIFKNTLLENRLEGIYIEADGGENNNVHGNDITFPPFSGTVADFEKVWPEDYRIFVLPDDSAAEVSFSFPENASYDGSRALKLEYIPYIHDSVLSIFGAIGQDWSGYQKAVLWVKPDEDVLLELEFAEHDGDVWFYIWQDTPLTVGSWNRLDALISQFRLRQRSIGDGELNLRGIGYYRLTLISPQPHGQQRTIFFDNIYLGN